jgi:hypothetical protein
MGTSKKQIGELERLQQENKDLKATIKSLQRQVKQSNRPKSNKKAQEELIQEEYDSKKPNTDCTNCGKGIIREVELGPKRSIMSCNVCTYHKVIKKDGKIITEEE